MAGTNTLKLIDNGDTITVKIDLDIDVKRDAEGNCDIAGVIPMLDKRLLMASKNIGYFNEVAINSKGRMTCDRETEDEDSKEGGDE